jgi:hypothetical protein
MRGAITLLPQYAFMEWCLVKHRDNFTLPFNSLPIGSTNIASNTMTCLHHYLRCIKRYSVTTRLLIQKTQRRDVLLQGSKHTQSCIKFPLVPSKASASHDACISRLLLCWPALCVTSHPMQWPSLAAVYMGQLQDN